MKNKNALVLPETLKIIIAVLCIFLLVYLAVSLYNLFIVKSDLAQAKETLKNIAAEVNDLGEGEQGEYLVVAPKDWYFITYGEKGCICSMDELLKGKEECCNEGASLVMKNSVILDSMCNFPLANPRLDYGGCLPLKNIPFNIYFIKSNEIVDIKVDTSMKVSGILNELFESKVEGDKTFEALCQEFVNKPSDSILREQVRSKVKDFFSGREEGIKFQVVEVSGDRIILQLFLDKGDEIIRDIQRYTFYQYSLDKKFTLKDSDGNEYLIILKIGEWKIIAGSGGSIGQPKI